MPRYEFSDGKSNKFWEIELDGTSFTTTYGRMGTTGQTSMKEYDSADKAKKEYDKLIAEKVKKGYTPVAADASKDEEEDEDDEDEDEDGDDEDEDGDEDEDDEDEDGDEDEDDEDEDEDEEKEEDEEK